MKIEDMIMVIENRKGVETNMLCTLTEFIVNFLIRGKKDQFELLTEILKLQETKQLNFWCENYEAANVSVNAKYCCSENELQIFLLGHLNDCAHEFSTERSSEACVKQLEVLGFGINGARLPGGMPKYEKLEREFSQGDVIRNLNGNTYRIMEMYSDRNMLLMDVNQGNFVVGLNVEFFAKYPRTEDKFSENCQYGIEWGHGVYLSATPSEIDFVALRREYGEAEREVSQDGKKSFDIEITETLQKIQTIEAECLGDAIDKAMDMYYGQQIILDAEDMKDVEFNQYKDSVEAQGKKR